MKLLRSRGPANFILALILVGATGFVMEVKKVVRQNERLGTEVPLLENEKSHLQVGTATDVEFAVTEILATSYNSTRAQTDDDPHIAASGQYVDGSTIALSRNLIQAENDLMIRMGFNPDGVLRYGDTVYVIYVKHAVVSDAMNRRYTDRVDIWTEDYVTARTWGKRHVLIAKRK